MATTSITTHEVARIFKTAVARYAATLPESERRQRIPSIKRISAHSTRIGAAQDLVENGADLVAVMQAGGWKATAMPALYTRRLSALRGGMAKLYRDAPSGASEVTGVATATHAVLRVHVVPSAVNDAHPAPVPSEYEESG